MGPGEADRQLSCTSPARFKGTEILAGDLR
jgi:hypothetical protein